MKIVYLIRIDTNEQGTRGIWITEDFECCSLELPWKNNAPNISCVPSGQYDVKMRFSRKFGNVYWVTNVDGRSWILVHSGNLAGDVKKGYKSHVQGCILLGKKWGYLSGQRAVLCSKPTVLSFQKYMEEKPFKLNIYEFYRKAA